MIFLVLFFAVILSVSFTIKANQEVKNIRAKVSTDIGSISYVDGNLELNDNQKFEFEGICIDTSKEDNTENEKIGNDLIIGKKYLSVNDDSEYIQINYSDIFRQDFNKDDVIRFIDSIGFLQYFILAVIFIIIIFIAGIIANVVNALVFACIGYLAARIIGNNDLKMGNIFKISIHSISLPILLETIYDVVNLSTGFTIKYFSVMYTSISVIYMIAAILLITADKNKNQENQVEE